MHHQRIFLIALCLFLQVCASALLPSNHHNIIHRKNDAACKKVSRKSSIFVVADTSLSSQDTETDTRPSIKQWILQGLTCNGCVERVRSFVQVRSIPYPVNHLSSVTSFPPHTLKPYLGS